MGGFAWVTLVTNDSYSLGALVLANSLRRVNTAHQLVVLITPAVTEAMKTQLSAVFNVVKVVDVLDSQDADNLALLARPELGITFTKLHCWRLTEFDKCVFLDADTLVLQNSDELFEREEFSAAPDAGWPDCFNSGVFVYKPSNETFNALIEFALLHGSFDGGDQGLLNLFFNDWATKDITKHLPFVYNMCSTVTYSYLPAFKQFGEGLKIVHFIGTAKPWLQPFNTESGLVQVSGESHHVKQFVQLWWDIFCAHVHPSLSSEMTWHRLSTSYVFTNHAQPCTQASTLPAVQSYFGPRPPPHASKPTAIDDSYSLYDPWDETNDQNDSDQLFYESYQDCNYCATICNFDLSQKHFNISGCEQFDKPISDQELEHEQEDLCGPSHGHSHHSDLSNTSITATPLPSCAHLEQGRFNDPGVCDPDGGGGGSLLWQRSSRQDSFSHLSVSAPVVVVSQSPWEPTHSQSSVASQSQQLDIQLPHAGLAAALASVTLGAPLQAEQSALEEHLRRQGWEEGNIDYMGKDSFSHIWQKICDTLASGSQPSTAEALPPSASDVSTTPVAPVAAPVFVSSVEMSPSGPIDTSPPASYVPVSHSKPTVVDSETEAASKVASAETATVFPEPKSSVTEVITKEASATSTASVQPAPATSSETPTGQDHAAPTLPAEDATRIEQTPVSLTSSQALVRETLPKSLPPSLDPQVLPSTAIEAPIPVLQKTDIPTTPSSGEAGTPTFLKSETAIKSDITTALVEGTPSPDKPAELVSTPATIVSTEMAASAVSAEAVKATAEAILPDIPTAQIEAVVTPAIEVLTGVPPTNIPVDPISTPGNVKTTDINTAVLSVEVVSTPPAAVSTETPTLSTQTYIVSTKTEAIPVDSIATVNPVAIDPPIVSSTIALPAEVVTPLASTETPIPLPTDATPTAESKLPLEISPVLASNDIPLVPVTAEPAKTSEVPTVPKDVPVVVLPSQTTQGTTEIQASDIPTPIKSSPEQPQTPTVIEPTPPTSPPDAPTESPLVSKLQVETEVPATPPVESGASQPSLATASTEEPPVPPKRKGGSKASQETKTQKGGKQSKGKK